MTIYKTSYKYKNLGTVLPIRKFLTSILKFAQTNCSSFSAVKSFWKKKQQEQKIKFSGTKGQNIL